ncbi:MAG: helix-turn-helix transcriptional regulator [Fluviicola sp.]|nr:helix-turn-helix transcriptional regulator [Fluviicola sp.]
MDSKQYRKILGKKIQDLRKKKRYKTEEFAEKSKIERTTLYRIETGNHNTSIDILWNIAVALEMPIESLMAVESSSRG